MLKAGYSHSTSRVPGSLGITHELLVDIAAVGSGKSTKVSAQHMARKAWRVLQDGLDHDDERVRLATAKVVLEQAKGVEGEDESAEEVARGMMMIRRWKRIFLRRGIMLGLAGGNRTLRLLGQLNLSLGKTSEINIPHEEELEEEIIDVEPVTFDDFEPGGKSVEQRKASRGTAKLESAEVQDGSWNGEGWREADEGAGSDEQSQSGDEGID